MTQRAAMAWTFRMRATSVAVAIYVALGEYLLVMLPIGAILWLAGAAGARRIAIAGSQLAAVWALAIVLVTHVQPFSRLLHRHSSPAGR
jgi:hypothetical protein